MAHRRIASGGSYRPASPRGGRTAALAATGITGTTTTTTTTTTTAATTTFTTTTAAAAAVSVVTSGHGTTTAPPTISPYTPAHAALTTTARAPSLSLVDLPEDIVACLIQEIRSGRTTRDFAFDVRNLALVSRQINKKVGNVAASSAGRTLRMAWQEHGNTFADAMFAREIGKAASGPGSRKTLVFFGDNRPPKALKALMARHDHLVLNLGKPDDCATLIALQLWGCYLPLSRLTISCDARIGITRHNPPARQFINQLGILGGLLKTLAAHPKARSLTIRLRVFGCGYIHAPPGSGYHRAMEVFVKRVLKSKAVKEIDFHDLPEQTVWEPLRNREGLIVRRDDRLF